MRRYLVLASHGHYASGALSALQTLLGKIDSVSAIDCYVEEYFDLQEVVNETIRKHSEGDLVIVTDIFGGSVNNEFMQYLSNNVFLVAGMNLPFLLELAVKLDSDLPTKEIIKSAICATQDSLKLCNTIDLSKRLEDENF